LDRHDNHVCKVAAIGKYLTERMHPAPLILHSYHSQPKYSMFNSAFMAGKVAFSPNRAWENDSVPSKKSEIRCVAAKDTSPNTKSLLMRHKKKPGEAILVQTFKNNKLEDEEAVEFDVNAAMNERLDMLTDGLHNIVHEKNREISVLQTEMSTDRKKMAEKDEEIVSKDALIAELEKENHGWLKQKALMFLTDQTRASKMVRLLRENDQLKDRVEILERVVSINLSDKLRDAKQTLTNMPETSETKPARKKMMRDIQAMEHLIFFGMTGNMDGMAEF
jgi:hypothetical protein